MLNIRVHDNAFKRRAFKILFVHQIAVKVFKQVRWIKEKEDAICGIQRICYPQIRHTRTQLILKELTSNPIFKAISNS